MQKWINEGRVWVNGQLVRKPSHKLKKNDCIQVKISTESVSRPTYEPSFRPIRVVYEDDDIIVLNKPAGVVVHPAPGHWEDSLVQRLWAAAIKLSPNEQEPWRAGVVHRLDKETSGLLVFAKNSRAHGQLAAQFRDKKAQRIYQAVASGLKRLLPKEGTIQSFLRRHPVHRHIRHSVRDPYGRIIRSPSAAVEGAKWAITHYFVWQSRGDLGLHWVILRLETGRTHQIRVHLSELGFPILNDRLYSWRPACVVEPVSKAVQDLKDTIFLHAWKLMFEHPTSGQKMIFTVDWDEPILNLLQTWFPDANPEKSWDTFPLLLRMKIP